jgi:hypothetical protein
MGVPHKIITIIKVMYDNYVCFVSHKGKLSDPFPTWSGVKQGGLLSPLLLILVMDEVMENLWKYGVWKQIKGRVGWK